jgi:hypothetical protein
MYRPFRAKLPWAMMLFGYESIFRCWRKTLAGRLACLPDAGLPALALIAVVADLWSLFARVVANLVVLLAGIVTGIVALLAGVVAHFMPLFAVAFAFLLFLLAPVGFHFAIEFLLVLVAPPGRRVSRPRRGGLRLLDADRCPYLAGHRPQRAVRIQRQVAG